MGTLGIYMLGARSCLLLNRYGHFLRPECYPFSISSRV
jgi:hypothetical protein